MKNWFFLSYAFMRLQLVLAGGVFLLSACASTYNPDVVWPLSDPQSVRATSTFEDQDFIEAKISSSDFLIVDGPFLHEGEVLSQTALIDTGTTLGFYIGDKISRWTPEVTIFVIPRAPNDPIASRQTEIVSDERKEVIPLARNIKVSLDSMRIVFPYFPLPVAKWKLGALLQKTGADYLIGNEWTDGANLYVDRSQNLFIAMSDRCVARAINHSGDPLIALAEEGDPSYSVRVNLQSPISSNSLMVMLDTGATAGLMIFDPEIVKVLMPSVDHFVQSSRIFGEQTLPAISGSTIKLKSGAWNPDRIVLSENEPRSGTLSKYQGTIGQNFFMGKKILITHGSVFEVENSIDFPAIIRQQCLADALMAKN